MIQEKAATSHHLVMKNRPGELMKLTKFLSDAGVNVSGLRVANLGDKASIQFSAPKEFALPQGFGRSRLG